MSSQCWRNNSHSLERHGLVTEESRRSHQVVLESERRSRRRVVPTLVYRQDSRSRRYACVSESGQDDMHTAFY